jgi:hypothetical protein
MTVGGVARTSLPLGPGRRACTSDRSRSRPWGSRRRACRRATATSASAQCGSHHHTSHRSSPPTLRGALPCRSSGRATCSGSRSRGPRARAESVVAHVHAAAGRDTRRMPWKALVRRRPAYLSTMVRVWCFFGPHSSCARRRRSLRLQELGDALLELARGQRVSSWRARPRCGCAPACRQSDRSSWITSSPWSRPGARPEREQAEHMRHRPKSR